MKTTRLSKTIPSVNFHVWEPCNMRCKFCFATFQDVKATVLPKGHLPKEEALNLVHLFGQFGFKKITFVGGEPTLCPWLYDMLEIAKLYNMITMIVTNGSKLQDTNYLLTLKPFLDWIALSIDSLDPKVNAQSGRFLVGKKAPESELYMHLVKNLKSLRFRLKVNTVVHSLNWKEDMTEFILAIKPDRWKIFQALPIKGQNDVKIDPLLVVPKQFDYFIERHEMVFRKVPSVYERNNRMIDSYLMIDPAGRIFNNKYGLHSYSQPILEIGLEKAIEEVCGNFGNFIRRGGLYDW